MKKQTRNGIIIGILAFAVIVGFLFYFDVLQTITGTGEYIERPVFSYIKCEAIGALKYTTDYSISSSGTWANKPSVTDQYNIIVSKESVAWNDVPYLKYSICNSKVKTASNCRVFERKVPESNIIDPELFKGAEITGVRPEEFVFLDFRTQANFLNLFKDKGISGGSYKVSYIPFGLREYNVLSGSSRAVNANDCTVSTSSESWIDRFLNTNSEKIDSLISENVNERVLQPNEVRWYVAGYVTSAAPSFALKYKGQDAWCRVTGTTAEIYKINTVTVGSGVYKIASPDWSDYLGSEKCCPGQTRGSEVCQPDFTWKAVTGSECGAFKSCGSSNWVPYSPGKIIKYSCVNGYCKEEIKPVMCSSDFDCGDENKICDLNTYTCVEANVNLIGDKIITQETDSTDNKTELCPGWYQYETTAITKDYGILYWRALFNNPVEVPVAVCKTHDWVFGIMGGVIILILGGVLIYIWRPEIAKKRMKKK